MLCYKLDPTVSGNGSLLFSTYLGGTGGEFANGIAVDANQNAYVVGQTFSSDFPASPAPNAAYQSTFNPLNAGNASGSAFLSKISTNATPPALVYSTYLSGNAANAATANTSIGGDIAYGVAVDGSNNAYVVGATSANNISTDIPSFPSSTTANQAFPPAANTGGSAFVSKVNTAASGATSLVYSTYIAGLRKRSGTASRWDPTTSPMLPA